jgi:ATP-dependent RNA helicase DDX24/MAK5
VLLATDVAARGLDVRDLEFVVHYQMPFTVEAYVHRSGRTARAGADGVCIALVDPPDEKRYRMICHGLGPDTAAGFQAYALPASVADVLPRVHRAIHLAVKLDADLHHARKRRVESDWLARSAREMEIELDDELQEEVSHARAEQRSAAVSKKEQLRVRDELRRLLHNIARPTAAQRAAAPHGVPLPV